MKQIKKMLCILLVIILTLSLVTGCGKEKAKTDTTESTQSEKAESTTEQKTENSNVNKEGLPIVSEAITLKFIGSKLGSNVVPMSEMSVYQRIQEDTNINIEWEEVPSNIWADKSKLILASNDLPDAFCGMAIDELVVNSSGQGGTLISLNDLIESEYSHNLKNLFEANPDILKFITSADGNVYALPTINAPTVNMTLYGRIQLNQKWMDNLGLETPKTTEDYYNVLKAFKEQDANANGDSNDEIAFSTIHLMDVNTIASATNIMNLGGAFGIPYGAEDHIYIKDSEIFFAPAQEGYKDFIEYMHKLSSEGLIDEESFSQDVTQMKAKTSGNGVGSFISNAAFTMTEGDGWQDYVAIEPLIGPDGIQEWGRQSELNTIQKNRFCITSSNEYPEATFRWIDYCLDDDEISTSIRFGEKGKSWDTFEDGTWDKITKDSNGEPMDGAKMSKFAPQQAGVWVLLDGYLTRKYSGATLTMDVSRNMYLPYVIDEAYPQLTMSEEDLKEFNQIKIDLLPYVNSEFAKFVLNGIDDDSWNSYLEKLEKLNYQRYVELLQKYYTEFKN